MNWLLITLISLGEALIHYVLHHKAQVAMALAGAAGWVAHRTHLTDIPLFASDEGRHRPSSRKMRRALKRDRRETRKQARRAAALKVAALKAAAERGGEVVAA